LNKHIKSIPIEGVASTS